ncbi:MAG: hypothetical protein ACOCVV_08570 [Marinobacter sp.]
MNTAITLRKFAVITAGLLLTATASVGHAQQKWMEEVLERSLQEQAEVKEVKEEQARSKAGKQNEATDATGEGLSPEEAAPDHIDVSDHLYNDEGEPRI